MQFKKPLFLIFIFLLPAISFANKTSCHLTGNWFDFSKSVIATFSSDSTGETGVFANSCGRRQLTAIVNGKQVIVALTVAPGSTGICALDFKWIGEFSNDCSSIVGDVMTSSSSPVFFQWFFATGLQIVNPNSLELIISPEPKMPDFNASIRFTHLSPLPSIKNSTPPYKWSLKMDHVLGETGIELHDELTANTDEPFFTPAFENLDGFRGGSFTLSVAYYDYLYDRKEYVVKGTNPGKEAINQILNPTMRHIACQESSYRHFKANREGGIGFPLIGVDDNNRETGGIGLMQLFDPPPPAPAIWNWKENIIAGIDLFNKKLKEAQTYHIRMRNRLNKERAAKGLPICPEGTPPPLNAEQLERETIRRYNCGTEYYWETQDDKPNCEGQWIIDPSCKRKGKKGYDPTYVDKILKCNI